MKISSLCLIFIFFLTACSNDSSLENRPLGKWKMVKIESYVYQNNGQIEHQITNVSDLGIVYVFRNNGLLTTINESESLETTFDYKIENNYLYIGESQYEYNKSFFLLSLSQIFVDGPLYRFEKLVD